MIRFFKTINEGNLNPNQFYVLYCISNDIEAQMVNIHLEMRNLKKLGYIDKDRRITPAGQIILDKISKSITPAKTVTKEVVIEKDLIQNYLDLWPAIKLPTGKYARSDKSNLEAAFKWFFKNFNYSWDTIMKATKRYVDEYRLKNWDYMRTSQYFIRKTSSDKSMTSDLADYCMLVESGQQEEIPSHNKFIDKVV